MLELRKGSERNTQCHVVQIGDHEFFFSYQTCVAYRSSTMRCRLENVWGPTTGRHINEMGVKAWPIVTKEVMENTVEYAINGKETA